MPATLEIPIFPLGTVLYPGGLLPLRIFEQRYLAMTKSCIRDDTPFGVCLIREGAEVGAAAVPHAVGCTARIAQWDMPHLGLFQLSTQGDCVFRILEQWTAKGGLVQAQVELDDPPVPLPLPQEYEELGALLERIIAKIGASRFPSPTRLDLAGWVAYRLAELLPLELDTKQRLLEGRDPIAALREVKGFLQSRQIAL
ncbi:MAG TPA: LON peptidase substrate-binding domain-containing protein [Burkholderiales bacterium]|nr:LON peptidase substrate-binding domain-containing protein [Burkholderiales bacterium]